MEDIPLLVLTATVWTYWLRVAFMIGRARRHSGHTAGLIPHQRLERLMWLVWVPLVAAWLVLPLQALWKSVPPFAVPAFAREQPVFAALRWIAAGGALCCLLLTQRCWSRMGADWRMDVRTDVKPDLIMDGLYARVRHPIYALSILLMLCTALIVPTTPVIAMALVHAALMNVKARNEERYLLLTHGPRYESYLQRTGRFVPRRAGS